MPLRTVLIFAVLAVVLAPSKVLAADMIALAVPLNGPYALLGKQTKAGAEAAAKALGKTLMVIDDGCEADNGAQLADAVAASGAQVAIGFLCLESLGAALPMLKDKAIPTLSIAARADALTLGKAKSGFLFSRISPRDGMEAEALARQVLPLWRKKNFAIVDDGTINARDLAESFRQAAAEAGLKPVFSDTFRPGLDKQNALASRLQKAGATHVFFGGSIDDAVILSRDAKSYGGLTLALGESAAPSDPAIDHGTILALALADATLKPEAAAAKLAIGATGIVADNYALLGHAAVEIAAAGGAVANGAAGPFQTAIGSVAFDENGDLAANPFLLAELKAGAFVPLPKQPAGQ